MSFSILAPFFPQEAEKKGTSLLWTGIIFGIFNVAVLVVSPFAPRILQYQGSNRVVVGGMICEAGFQIGFALVDVLHGNVFTGVCVVMRVLQGMASCMTQTGVLALIISSAESPDEVGFLFGMMEACGGVGLLFGPMVGGYAYAYTGYRGPFFLLGSVILVSAICLALCTCGVTDVASPATNTMHLWRRRDVLLSFYIIVLGFAGLASLDPVLSLHLRESDLSTPQIGLIFSLLFMCYTVSAPVSGFIGSRIGYLRLVTLGFLVISLSYLALGPSPLLPSAADSVPVKISAMAAMGLGASMLIVPVLPYLTESLLRKKVLADPSQFVASISTASFALGATLGPLLGSSLVQCFGFGWAYSVFAGLNILTALLVMCEELCRSGGVESDGILEDSFSLSNSYHGLPSEEPEQVFRSSEVLQKDTSPFLSKTIIKNDPSVEDS
eukprot:gb/GEZN01004979.1/.p1 GENE.gb/GEZN01004979.1/~~gb/GEZN01004979.1/.p1  ORF type:complete len:440 (+),score=39.63 gb/GEZN01004979.1/:290-1609(+)